MDREEERVPGQEADRDPRDHREAERHLGREQRPGQHGARREGHQVVVGFRALPREAVVEQIAGHHPGGGQPHGPEEERGQEHGVAPRGAEASAPHARVPPEQQHEQRHQQGAAGPHPEEVARPGLRLDAVEDHQVAALDALVR